MTVRAMALRAMAVSAMVLKAMAGLNFDSNSAQQSNAIKARWPTLKIE